MRQKQAWKVGDVFLVRQKDQKATVGQVLAAVMDDAAVSGAFFDLRVDPSRPDIADPLPTGRIFAAVSFTREKLDKGIWVVVTGRPVSFPRVQWPNERFRRDGWVGAKIYNASIIEEFLNAFFGLVPWDDWKDPEYLDRLLLSPDKKPTKVVRKGAPL